jgi:hypothetical protein
MNAVQLENPTFHTRGNMQHEITGQTKQLH